MSFKIFFFLILNILILASYLLNCFPEIPRFVLQKWERDGLFAFFFMMKEHFEVLLSKFVKRQMFLLLS